MMVVPIQPSKNSAPTWTRNENIMADMLLIMVGRPSRSPGVDLVGH
jgi:hypothetical protein